MGPIVAIGLVPSVIVVEAALDSPEEAVYLLGDSLLRLASLIAAAILTLLLIVHTGIFAADSARSALFLVDGLHQK